MSSRLQMLQARGWMVRGQLVVWMMMMRMKGKRVRKDEGVFEASQRLPLTVVAMILMSKGERRGEDRTKKQGVVDLV